MGVQQLNLFPEVLRLERSPVLAPLLKWPGGKSGEMAAIADASPPLTGRLIDPFVGGGAVLLAAPPAVRAWANDACADLVRVYEAALADDPLFRATLAGIGSAWDALADAADLYAALAHDFALGPGAAVEATLARHEAAVRALLQGAGPGLDELVASRVRTDVPAKLARMRRLEAKVGFALTADDLAANVEGAVRACVYTAIRARYNRARTSGRWDGVRAADFLVLRELAYAAMFRFNAAGEFNVPYGGVTYNRKPLRTKAALLFGAAVRERLAATTWRCSDFGAFLEEAAPVGSDFVFVDPPYDSDFSAYDGMPFDERDQRRLAEVLTRLPARVMVVIKDTPLIRRLYEGGCWRVTAVAKTYMWTIKSRNERQATHLLITNY